ncbi:MAG: epoxyqueuosine reductase QueH [Bacilli bacterium]|mgnify:FL=1|nr:epoxyqueuosine reductase QueH [Bacilli bacterium]
MKENYSVKCENILNNLDGKKKLLLHSCCGPCSSYVISYLTNYFDITILYYNPNIYPYDEYLKRKQEQIKLINEIDCSNNLDIMDCDYDNDLYEKCIIGLENEPERGNRCMVCYNLRMEKTAKMAKECNYDYFCTTLSVSPYKNSEWINKIGEKLQNKYNINWLYSDFKKKDGYKQSILLSKKYNLYRQDYCGCIYSKPH